MKDISESNNGIKGKSVNNSRTKDKSMNNSSTKAENRSNYSIKGKSQINVRKLVILALFTSQAMVLSIVESWIPMPLNVPGVKPGLANIITLAAIMTWGLKEALVIMFIRVVTTSFFTGGVFALLFSLAGGVCSIIVMHGIYRKMQHVFSTIGISIAGAITHNIGQLVVAALIMEEIFVLTYLPVLMISGIIMGIFTGACTGFLLKALALVQNKTPKMH